MEINEETKEALNMLLIIVLLVGFLAVGIYGITVEHRYNECVMQFNNCSENCLPTKRINTFNQEFEFDLGALEDG